MLAGLARVRRARLGPRRRCGCRRWRSARSRSARWAWRSAALAREVRAASLLAFVLSLPMAFLALVPSGAVGEGLYDVITRRSRSCSRSSPRSRRSTPRSTAARLARARCSTSLALTLVFGVLARARRCAARRPERAALTISGMAFPRPACAGCARPPACATSCARPSWPRGTWSTRCSSSHGTDGREPIATMPGIERLSIADAVQEAGEAAALGIPAVLLFGMPADKDEEGSGAWDDEGVVQLATRAIKQAQPDLLVITDVCLCEYTEPRPLRRAARRRRGRQRRHARAARPHRGLARPRAGADIVAPSDMMDGRVGAIRAAARRATASPRRRSSPTARSSPPPSTARFARRPTRRPQFGDRRGYQMDPANAREAVREALLDVAGGRRHGDGQARAALPRRDPPRQGAHRACPWRPTTSAASTR